MLVAINFTEVVVNDVINIGIRREFLGGLLSLLLKSMVGEFESHNFKVGVL